jgi:hypothetical protein
VAVALRRERENEVGPVSRGQWHRFNRKRVLRARPFVIITVVAAAGASVAHRLGAFAGPGSGSVRIEGPDCPFPFSRAPFRCNGQLKTIQTRGTKPRRLTRAPR